MPGEAKGHGSSANHGHGHKPGQEAEESTASRKSSKGVTNTASKPKNKTKIQKVTAGKEENVHWSSEEKGATVIHSKHETIIVPYDKSQNGATETDHVTNSTTHKTDNQNEPVQEKHYYTIESRQYTQSRITPSNFNVREFNTNLTEFIRTLDDPRYSQIDQECPVEEFLAMVNMITKSVNDYRQHTQDSHIQLEHLTERMRTIRENLHFTVSRQAMNLSKEDKYQSQEERDLMTKLTQLNAVLAQANAEVTESLRLATEAQSTAVRANIAAEKARDETRRLEEEAIKHEKSEQKKREDEARRKEDEKRQKEAEERKSLEERQRKEEEWKKMEALQNEKLSQHYDHWTPVQYVHVNDSGETEITCIARGPPGYFDEQNFNCKIAKSKEDLVTYLPNEELISQVIELSSPDGHQELKHPVYVAIPHVMSRTNAQSREAIVKAMVEGEWKDLPTRDVTFDTHKDTKFAQAEVCYLTTLIVMSRFKRDYVSLLPNKSYKVTSSFDQRITLDIDKDTLAKKEHFLLQVQPVDSTTLQDFRTRQSQGKSILSCSPIVYTQWDANVFKKPVQVTLPCPPNPAKAKKMALARKLKEEKLKNPVKPPMSIEEQEKEKEKEKKRMQEYIQSETGPAKVTKWYMGDYANTDEIIPLSKNNLVFIFGADGKELNLYAIKRNRPHFIKLSTNEVVIHYDDENDRVHLVYMQGGRWFIQSNATIKQIKVDVVTFQLTFPVERFMVLRTRTSLDEDSVISLVILLNEFLGKRFVEVVVRQKTDNPYEVVLQVTPISRRDQVVKQLAQNGFDSGPAPSHVICLHEGDIIELGFSGNIECTNNLPDQLIYKSNVPTMTYFTVKEENKFRQKEHDYYSGLICLTRKYLQTNQKGKKQDGQEKNDWKSERICSLQINIPKYHVSPNVEPMKAPVHMDNNGPVDKDLLMTLADQMGDEWKKVAHYLGVHKARVQAIVRNVTVGERTEKEAKYDMLLTWIKGAAKALDKVSALSVALENSDRNDLAETVRLRGQF